MFLRDRSRGLRVEQSNSAKARSHSNPWQIWQRFCKLSKNLPCSKQNAVFSPGYDPTQTSLEQQHEAMTKPGKAVDADVRQELGVPGKD